MKGYFKMKLSDLAVEHPFWLFWTFGIGSPPEFPSVHSIGRYYFTKEKPLSSGNTLKKD